jgi:hypothetical protein
VTVVGGTPSSALNDIKLKAEVIEISNPPAPVQKPFTVADTIITKDVIVVAWVDAATQTLSTVGVSPGLINALDSLSGCPTTLNEWKNGNPIYLTDLLGRRIEANRRYANAWLINHSGNQPPPTDLTGSKADDFADDTGKYRLFARFQIEMCVLNGKRVGSTRTVKQVANIGETPAPCTAIFWDPDGEYAPDNNSITPLDDVRIGLLNRGRIGKDGQAVNATINCRTTPYIWSNIIFSALKTDGTYDEVRKEETFPTYWIYVDGRRVGEFKQKDVEEFIKLGTSIPCSKK